MDFRKVTPEHIKLYRNEVLKSASASTFDRKIFSLKKFYDWAVKEGYVEENPVEEFLKLEAETVQEKLGKIEKQRKLEKPSYSSLQARIIAKLAGKPKLQKLAYNAFYTRPNWYKQYHSLPIANYFNYAILVILMSGLGFAAYNQFFKTPTGSQAYPTALTRAGRYLSFQGRLTNKVGNPITTSTNLDFKLYNASTSGTLLWDSGSCAITPDTDGIFSTLLGSSCGSEISSSVFTENPAVWLGVTVGTDPEATPRVQIATVAYALNSETLQGFPASASATANTIPAINSLGYLVLGSASPKIQSTSGNFAIEGQAMTLTTPTGSNGSITIAPDGTGSTNLQFSGATPGNGRGMLYITDANLNSKALIYGSVANDATGYNLLELASGTTPRTKFAIDSAGNATLSGTINGLAIAGGNITTGVWQATAIGTQYGGTGQNWSSVSQGSIPYFNGTGTMTTLAPSTSGYILSTNGTGANPSWIPASGVGTNYWRLVSGAISPFSDSLDVLFGSSATVSAKFAFTGIGNGTPTVSISGTTSGSALFMDGNGNIATTNGSDLVLGNSSSYSSTGNILLNPSGGNVGIGTANPTSALAVNGDITATGVIRNVTVNGTTSTAAATAEKTVSISNYSNTGLTTGDLFAITFTNGNTVAAATLNINSIGAKNIRLNNSNVTTTNFTLAAGATVLMYYDGTYFQIMGSQRTTDTDTNTYDRTYWNNAITAGVTIYDYKIVMQASDGKWYPLTLETGTGTTKTVSTRPFLINSPILFYNSTTDVAANTTFTNVYSEIPTTYLNYTSNTPSWTSQLPIYLKGTVDSDGYFVLDNTSYTSFMTQTLPTTDDGFVYILLGQMYSTTGIRLFQYHPIYQYKFGAVREYSSTYGLFLASEGGYATVSASLAIGNTNAAVGPGHLNMSGDLNVGGTTTLGGLTYTWPGSRTNGFLVDNGSGALSWTTSLPSGTTIGFDKITTGTNTSQTLTVGNGSSLTYTGTGTINATTLTGNTWAAPGTIGSTTPNTGAFTTLTSTGVTTLGNNTNTVAINSNDWDIDTTGAMSGIGAISMNGAITGATGFNGLVVTPNTGVITTGTWNGTAIGTQYGGTGQNWSGVTAGNIPYFNGTGTMTTLAPAGTNDYVLTSQGAAAPQWKDVTTLVPAAVNYWQLANHVLAPANAIDYDLAIGGTATASSKFQVNAATGNIYTANNTVDWTLNNAVDALNIDSNTLSVDAANNRVGIGTNSPSYLLSLGGASKGFSEYNSGGSIDAIKAVGNNLGANFGTQNLNASGFSGVEYIDNSGSVAVFTGYRNGGSGEFRFNNIAPNGYITFKIAGSDKLTIANDGKIGVGNVSPSYLFDVSGTGRFTGDLTLGSVANVADNNKVLTVDSGIIKYTDTTNWDKNQGNDITTFLGLTDTPSTYSGSGSYVVRVKNDTTGLEFVDSSAIGTNHWQLNSNVLAPINISNDLAIGGNATGSAKFQVLGTTGNITTANNTIDWTLNNAVDALNIDSNTLSVDAANNRVGIGTNAPTASLQINAPNGITGLVINGGTTDNTDLFKMVGNGNTQRLILQRTGGATTFLEAGGSIGLFGTSTNHDFRIRTNYLDRMSITATGSVGIGTTSPTAKLDVNGDLNVETYATASASLALGNTGAAAGPGHLNMSGNLTVGGTTGLGGRTYTWPGTETAGFLITNGSGGLSWTTSLPSGTTIGFDKITTGTNTSQTLTVGNGSSLTYTGTGTINATTLTGNTWAAPGTIGSTTPNTGAFTTLTSTGVTTLGNNTNTVAINSNDWDIDTTGAMSGIGAISMNGAITGATGFNGLVVTPNTGVITTGTWNGTAIGATYGGTGQTSYAVGDLLYANSTTTLNKLADVATGNVLISGGVNTAPSWGKVVLGTHTTGNYVSTITGTANQITASASTGDITLSIPSDFRAPGTVNAVNGIYTGVTAGTQRIDASGNLINIANISASGYATVSGSLALGNTTAPAGPGNLAMSGDLGVAGAFKDSTSAAGSSGQVLTSTGTGTAWSALSGLSVGNADTLDNLDSLQFLRSDTSDNFTSGTLALDTGTTLDINGDLSIADTSIALDGASTNLAATGDFSVNTNDLFIQKSTGYVGIGTTTPSVPLDVAGNVNIVGSTLIGSRYSSSAGLYRFQLQFRRARGTVTTPLAVSANDSMGSFTFSGYDGASFVFPAAVESLVDGTVSSGSVPGRLSFVTGTNGTDRLERLVIKSNGNVGIGTTSPTAKLDVAGNVNVSGYATASGSLALGSSSALAGPGNLAMSGDLSVAGAFKDSTSAAGSSGQVLTSTGTGTAWSALSGLSVGNADTLDNLDSLQFLRSDTSDNFTSGTLALDTGTTLDINGDLSIADTSIALDGTSTNLAATGDFSVNTNNLFIQKSTGNVGVGTASPGSLLSLKSVAANESATLGSELLSSSGWTSTNWTGDWATGWTHTVGFTDALSNTLAAVINNYYQIAYTVTGRTAGSFTVAFGGQSKDGITATGTFGPRATTTGNLIITPTSDFNGTVIISIKQITGNSIPTFALYDNTGISNLEMRSSLNTLANTFIGKNAGAKNTTGSQNSAQGNGALYFNTTGNYNSAQGTNALYFNTTGYNNSAQGVNALLSNTTGNNNSAQGTNALYFNTTGYANSAQGVNALFSNTTGNYNSAQGGYALYQNTTGIYNSAQGMSALYSNTTGSNNSALGVNALYNLTGSYNNNTALGVNSGRYYNGTTGNLTAISNSLFLGASASALNATGDTNEIVIGYNAIGNGSNSVTLGNTSITKTMLNGGTTITGHSDTQQLIVKGNATQTSNLAEFQNSLGTVEATIDNSGNLTLAGTTTLAGRTYTWPGSETAGFLTTNGTGTLGWTTTLPAGTTLSFTNLTGGTNTTAAMVVGAGASLNYTSTGTINASSLGTKAESAFFTLSENETVTGIPAFNGGTTGSTAPFTVDSTYLVSNLNADLLDGYQANALPYVNDAANGTLTRSGAGPYTLSLNLGNANTWTGVQTFNANTLFPGSGIWNTSGNVGIGTTGPTGKLTVVGSSGDYRSVSIDSREIKFRGDGVAHMSIFGPDTSKSYITFQNTSTSTNTGTAGTDLMTILSSGNVGIGTTSPGAKLEVAGQVKITGGTPGANQVLTSDAYGLATWEPITSVGGIDGSGTLNYIPKFTPDGNTLGNSSIFDNGNVGIGTTNPISGSKLHVAGPVAIWPTADGSFANTRASLHLAKASENYLLMTKPGINTAGIALTTSNQYVFANENGPIMFKTGVAFSGDWETTGTVGMIFTTTGNVGIGTTFAAGAPADKLTVAGGNATVYNTASLGSEKVINGAFATVPDTAWTWGTGWAHDTTNFEADHTAGNTAALEQSVSAVAGEIYQVVFTVLNRTAGSVTPQVGGVNGAAISSNSTSTQQIRATGTGNLKFTPTTDFDGSVDTVSVKLITGGDLKLAGLLTGGGTSGIKVTAAGNVGIGTTTPGATLDVNGNIRVAAPGSMWISGKTGSGGITSSTQLTTGSYHPLIRQTTSSGHVINLGGLGDDWGFFGYDVNRTANGYDYNMTMDLTNGNVGIGTITPAAKLDVNGTFTVSGSNLTTLGGNLTVTGTAWTATPTISGLITATSGLTANGALTANNTFTLGDNGDIGSINTSDWDISTTGDMAGIGAITMNGAITGSTGFNGLVVTPNTGVITTGTWNGTAIGTQYGGTGANNSSAAQYSVPYYSSTGVLGGVLTPGTAGYVLTTNSTGGAPTWTDAASVGTNYWKLGTGTVSPFSDTLDVLIGNSATTSAKFAFKNVLTGTPTASISGTTTNVATFIDGNGNISTTNRNNLVLGNSSTYNSTGNILLNPNGTGYVGIGTTNPNAPVTIGTQTTGTTNLFQIVNQNNQNAFLILKDGNNSPYFYLYDSTGSNRMIDFRGNMNLIRGNLAIGATSFPGSKLGVTGNLAVGVNYGGLTAPTSGAIIEGNVGIGTTSPTAKLDVNGNLNVSTYATVSASLALGNTTAPAGPGNLAMSGDLSVAGAFKDSTSAAGSSGQVLTSTGTGTAWSALSGLSVGNADTLDNLDSLQFLRSDTSDNYTSGTLALDTGTTLDINGDLSIADTNIALDGTSTNLAATGDFSVNTNNLFIQKSTGNVGIGTTSPTAKLDVVGNVNISGYATASGSLALGNTTAAIGPGHLNMSGNLVVGGTTTLGGRTYTWPGSETAGFLTTNGTGTLGWTTTLPAGTTLSFTNLTSGTNTAAAMVVGAGASLNYTSTGTINASSLIGGTWAAPGAIGSTTPNTGAFTTLSSTGVTTLGNGTNTVAINSNDWDISTTGDMTGIGAIAMNGAITGATGFNGLVVTPNTGVITTGTWNGTAIGTQYGGTGQNWSGVTAGNIPYFNGTGTMTTLAPAGTNDYVLTSQGAAAPQWKDVTTLVPAAINYWQLANHVLAPANHTDYDLAVGGTATTSSKFQIMAGTGNLYSANNTIDWTLNSAVDALNIDSNTLSIDASNNRIGIGTAAPSQALDLIGSLELEETTSSTTGVIYKGSSRFIHNYNPPVNAGSIDPQGENLFVGLETGNFTMGSTATETYHASMNVGIGGKYTLDSLTTGYQNVAVGTSALSAATSGFTNTAVGYASLYNLTSGSSNVALGYGAGRYITGGSTANTTPDTSLYLGSNTKAYADGDSNEIVIGYNAVGNGSNSVTLGNTSITKTILNGGTTITGHSDTQQLIVKGNATQTSNLAEFQNSLGTVEAAIDNSGNLTLAGVVNAGGKIGVAYNAFALSGDSPVSSAITTSNDLFVGGDFEVKGGLYLPGRNIYNVVGGVSIGTIAFAVDPAALDSYNSLKNGVWLTENTTNNGIAALMVNQAKGGDIFTASASGVPKLVIKNDGSVGIGTATPRSTFDLVSNQNAPFILQKSGSTGISFSSYWPTLAMNMYHNGSNWIALGNGYTSSWNQNPTTGLMSFSLSGSSATAGQNLGSYSGFERLSINSAGNIGIGTTSPTAKLDIAGDASTSGALVFRGTSPANIDVLNGDRLAFNTSVGGDTGLTERMTILNNGNLGIGTTTPTAKLDVAGTASVSGNLTLGYGSALQSAYGPLTLNYKYDANAYTAGVALLNSGYVGIGTASPTVKLYIQGDTPTGFAYSSEFYDGGPSSCTSGTYVARITAVKNGVESSGSQQVTHTMINSPNYQIVYTWNSVPGATAYRIYVGQVAGGALLTSGRYIEVPGTQTTGYHYCDGTLASIPDTPVMFAAGNASASGNLTLGYKSALRSEYGPLTLNYKSGADTWAEGLIINDISGNVGIGTTTPASLLSVYKTATNATGKAAFSINQYEGADIFTASASGETKFVIKDSGNIGIGTATPSSTLVIGPDNGKANTMFWVQGQGSTNTTYSIQTRSNLNTLNFRLMDNGAGYLRATAWTYGSDIRMKENISSITSGLDKILQLKPVNFDYISGPKNNLGFIAQDVQSIIPEAVSVADEDTGYLGLKTDFIIPYIVKGMQEQQLQISNDSGLLVNINLGSETNASIEKDTNGKYYVRKSGGQIINQIAGLANLIVANIKAGAIITGNVITENITAGTATIQNLAANSFTAFQGTVDNMLVKSGLVAGNINTKMISPLADSTNVTIQVGSATESGKLAIQNATGAEVASIDSSGNASFSGTINGQQLTIGGDATFSGTLVADNIKSKSLDEIQALLTQVRTDQDLLKQASDWSVLTATNSANLDQLALGDLYITNQAAINSLSVTNSLTLGTDIVFQSTIDNQNSIINSIDTLSSPLKIQSLAMAPIEMMAGLVKIDTFGNVQIAGNLAVAGQIESAGLTLKDNQQSIINNQSSTPSASLLSLQNTLGTNVATIDASGSARFNNVSTQGLTIAGAIDATASAVINGVIKTNATAGSGVVPAGVSEITIENASVTDYTLVYVTPTSSTDNYVLYVKSKGPGKFVVGFTNPISIDVNFNWWIVQTAQ